MMTRAALLALAFRMATELDAGTRREGVAIIRGELERLRGLLADAGVDDGWTERLSDSLSSSERHRAFGPAAP